MIKHMMIALAFTAIFVWQSPQTAAEEGATPQEVITKVKEAAVYLAKHGESGLKTFDSAESRFVWKDTYVFVYDCEDGLANVAHPVPETEPVKLAEDTDATGKVIGLKYCEAAARPGGGWLEYMWWKPLKAEAADELTYAEQPSRKVTYMLNVEGTPYQVGAGVYNDTLSVDDLNDLVEQGAMRDNDKAVRAAVDRWFVALNAMLSGDPAPFAQLYSHAEDVTYMGAEGTYRVGWEATYADWKAQAEKSTGGGVEGHDIHIVVNGDMATAVHYTQGKVKQPDGQMADIRLRETSVFRKEENDWRMIAHHADLIPFWAEAFHR